MGLLSNWLLTLITQKQGGPEHIVVPVGERVKILSGLLPYVSKERITAVVQGGVMAGAHNVFRLVRKAERGWVVMPPISGAMVTHLLQPLVDSRVLRTSGRVWTIRNGFVQLIIEACWLILADDDGTFYYKVSTKSWSIATTQGINFGPERSGQISSQDDVESSEGDGELSTSSTSQDIQNTMNQNNDGWSKLTPKQRVDEIGVPADFRDRKALEDVASVMDKATLTKAYNTLKNRNNSIDPESMATIDSVYGSEPPSGDPLAVGANLSRGGGSGSSQGAGTGLFNSEVLEFLFSKLGVTPGSTADTLARLGLTAGALVAFKPGDVVHSAAISGLTTGIRRHGFKGAQAFGFSVPRPEYSFAPAAGAAIASKAVKGSDLTKMLTAAGVSYALGHVLDSGAVNDPQMSGWIPVAALAAVLIGTKFGRDEMSAATDRVVSGGTRIIRMGSTIIRR